MRKDYIENQSINQSNCTINMLLQLRTHSKLLPAFFYGDCRCLRKTSIYCITSSSSSKKFCDDDFFHVSKTTGALFCLVSLDDVSLCSIKNPRHFVDAVRLNRTLIIPCTQLALQFTVNEKVVKVRIRLERFPLKSNHKATDSS